MVKDCLPWKGDITEPTRSPHSNCAKSPMPTNPKLGSFKVSKPKTFGLSFNTYQKFTDTKTQKRIDPTRPFLEHEENRKLTSATLCIADM